MRYSYKWMREEAEGEAFMSLPAERRAFYYDENKNIMIKESGLVKITDFGIAMALNSVELTQTNSVMGSVHYLPPEQASGKGSTIRSDIYSLGILMFEMLTGKMPYRGDSAVEIALKHMKEELDVTKIEEKITSTTTTTTTTTKAEVNTKTLTVTLDPNDGTNKANYLL